MNGYYIVGFVHPITWGSIGLALAAALPLDCTHGVATVVFLRAIYVPWERKLLRIKNKYALADAAIQGEPASPDDAPVPAFPQAAQRQERP